MKRILYIISIVLLFASAYFIYQWSVAEPDNHEPLPSLLTLASTIIVTIIAWKIDGNNKDEADQVDEINVREVEGSTVDIDPIKDTNISVSKIKDNSKVLINKGKDSLKDQG